MSDEKATEVGEPPKETREERIERYAKVHEVFARYKVPFHMTCEPSKLPDEARRELRALGFEVWTARSAYLVTEKWAMEQRTEQMLSEDAPPKGVS